MVQIELYQCLLELLLGVSSSLLKGNSVEVKHEYVKRLAGEDVQPEVLDLYVYDLIFAHAWTVPR